MKKPRSPDQVLHIEQEAIDDHVVGFEQHLSIFHCRTKEEAVRIADWLAKHQAYVIGDDHVTGKFLVRHFANVPVLLPGEK
jgi:hypothetical protein